VPFERKGIEENPKIAPEKIGIPSSHFVIFWHYTQPQIGNLCQSECYKVELKIAQEWLKSHYHVERAQFRNKLVSVPNCIAPP
jgi:hypothetical protein